MISKKQLSLLTYHAKAVLMVIAHGAVRTGKTLFLAYDFALFIDKVAVEHPVKGQNTFACLGQASVTATYDNVTVSVIQMLRLRGWNCKTQGKNYICKKKGRTIKLITASINNAVSYTRIQGGTFRAIFLDEAPLMNVDAIDMARTRIATFKDGRLYMTGNPEGGKSHWFYKTYLEKPMDKVVVLHFELKDNPIFTDEDIERFKVTMTTTNFRRKVLGEWVAPTGQCYPRQPKIVDKFILSNRMAVGVDYADVNDATTAPAALVNDTKLLSDYQVVDQYYWKSEDTMLMTTQLNRLRQYVWELYRSYRLPIKVVFENAPAALFITADSMEWNTLVRNIEYQELSIKQPRWDIDVEGWTDIQIEKVGKGKEDLKSKSAISERIQGSNILIGQGRLTIHKQAKDKPLVAAFEEAIYKDGVRLDNGSTDIDSLDGFEYLIKPDLSDILRTEILTVEEEQDE